MPKSVALSTLALGLTLLVAVSPVMADSPSSLADEGRALVASRCLGCHSRSAAGLMSRISQQRKTPEGWHMTLTRMQHNHGLVLSEREKDAVVKYLADSQGLAPAEAAPYRYVLERRNNTIEQYNAINRPDPQGIAVRCTVCHSYARFALQRRPEDEWRMLLHFHLAQFPAIEFHPASRLIPWWQQVEPTLPGLLAAQFPLDTQQWKTWRERPKADLSGTWRVAGYLSGVGSYFGRYTFTRVAPDSYTTHAELRFADGKEELADGTGVVYTGYEWRGRTHLRREEVREVFAVSEDGNEITGRWFVDRHNEQGGEFRAVRILPDTVRVLAVEPSSIRAGSRTRLTFYGINLNGAPELGPKIQATVLTRGADAVNVEVNVPRDATLGPRKVTLGGAPSTATLAVYDTIDHVEVEPAYAFSRLGEGGGKVPFVGAQFEAIAYAVSPEGGKTFALGALPAQWSLEPHTELAKQWNDPLYAGRITATGQFVPAQSGINPLRTEGTANNSGDLTVKATVEVDGRKLEGTSHLVVSTGPLYFNTPIR